jgi:hypothetical protein
MTGRVEVLIPDQMNALAQAPATRLRVGAPADNQGRTGS